MIEFRRPQIVTLHGKGCTDNDIAANLPCSKSAVNNVIVKFNADGSFHDSATKDSAQERPLNEIVTNALAKQTLRVNPCQC